MNKEITDSLKSIKVRDWYLEEFPEDELGEKISSRITFLTIYNALKSNRDIYETIGVDDSFVRERIFDMLEELLNLDFAAVHHFWLRKTADSKSLNSIKVRDWYCKAHPSDKEAGLDISSRITFLTVYNALKSNRDIYEVIGVGDSLIRERIFDMLAALLNVDYRTVLYLWLGVKENN